MGDKLAVPIKEFHPKKHPVRRIGGKAYNLGRLQEKGFKIPESYVLPTEWFKEATDEMGIFSKLEGVSFDNLAEVVEEIKEQFGKVEGQEKVKKLVPGLVEQISHLPKVSVRSSAIVEDTGEHSFAGQFSSVLDVMPTETELRKAIREVWQSAFSMRSLAYAIASEIDLGNLQMAVILQEMVEARVAGTMFTADVEDSYNSRVVVIQAVKGGGEAVVEGKGEVTTLRMEKGSKKTLGVEGEEMLTEKERRELLDVGLKLERDFGAAQDVEWAIDEQGLWILQTRPITRN